MGKRKSSTRVTLVLIGVAALAAACGDEKRRDVYATKEDCLADWGNKPQDCTPATEQRHASHGFWYGPMYGGFMRGGGGWSSRSGSRSIGSSSPGSGSRSSISRGGFGSSAHSSGG
jgi:uncharacterized protein YgiB involved in biofilm formation